MRPFPSQRVASCSRTVACRNRPCSSLAPRTGWLILRHSMQCLQRLSESLVGSFPTVMNLARLGQQQSKQLRGHKVFSEVYSWFTEEFDTKDLQEAKALLEQLT